MTRRARVLLGAAATVAVAAMLLAPPPDGAQSALAQSTTSTTSSTSSTSSTSPTTTTTMQTCSDILNGEGGSFLEPVVDKLLIDDASETSPLCAGYTNVKLDQAIADFVGTAPSTFGNDFAVSERPLTAAEASTAQSDGRGFAYVPFAATPVAIVTLVPTLAWGQSGATTIEPSDFCDGIPLSVTDLGDIFGYDSADPLTNWNDPRITCSASGGGVTGKAVSLWANNDPTMENEVLIALLDSNPTSKAAFDAGLTDASLKPVATSDAPSETWPYASNTIPGGDEPLIGKMLDVDPDTNAPDTDAADWALGAAAPISAVWTRSPLGVAWNLPTAAVPNAQGSYVMPTEAAAAAAENDATLASTQDPTTNNLVTFNASSTDAAAYNSYLMVEDYLVVPTNGLPSDKATKLAQFIRFVLGTTGQKDISSFGAAPATSAMVTAGLKVAGEVDAEGLSGSTSSTSSTTTTAGASTSATGSTGGGTGSAGNGTSATGSSGSDTGTGSAGSSGSGASSSASGSTLPFTGSDPWPLLIVGAVLVIVSEPCRRFLRSRRAFR